MKRIFLLFALFTIPLVFADTKEEPVGLVLSPGGAKLLRANTETPLAAKSGDLLFTGDGLKTETGPASFLFCPSKSLDTLSPAGELRFDAKSPKVKTGKISEAPARACVLPQTFRIAQASQQHLGVTMTRVGTTDFPPVPKDKLPANVISEITPLEAASSTDTNDPSPHIALAAVYEKDNLPANALSEYNQVLKILPDAEWVKVKKYELTEFLGAQQVTAANAAAQSGKTYALLVGISKYKLPELQLQFADRDAASFSDLVKSPRLGGIPPENVLLLTDEKATAAAVRNGFEDFLARRAGKNDSVVILLAGHGTVEVPGTKAAYVLTYDSDPQDLKSTALPMAEIQDLFSKQLANVGRVFLFVDVCKAGTIGTIKSTSVNADVEKLGDAEGSLFGLLASKPRELSMEGPQFGGGHGVFSYYVMKGLDGAADNNKDGAVDINELIKYVSDNVAQATNDKQHPREFGTYDNLKLADLQKPGIEVAHLHFRMLYDSGNGGPLLFAAQNPQLPNAQTEEDLRRFQDAIANRRILPSDPNNAFDALAKLKSELSDERYFERSNELRVALEDEAQKILLRYLQGDQNPQTRDDFLAGMKYMDAARQLTKDSLFLEGREDFFQGRALLFDKNYGNAAGLLEQSVRFDPSAAYAYNALGISYLEQADFEKAIPAFRDAARRAQHWSYPLHNLALAYVEVGNYRDAIKAYEQAEKLTPQYSYLPYNLGLVYQRLNRRKEAEESYQKAIQLSPNLAQAYNALGTLKAAEGKRGEAEQLYREALQKDSSLLPARHNLALLLAGEPNRQQEAIDLWRTNIQQAPDYVASRLSLAQLLNARGDSAGAIEQYRQVLVQKPGYIAAHVALAGLLDKTGDTEGALTEYRAASKADPQNGDLLEHIGDLEVSRDPASAVDEYRAALNLARDRAARKRIENKLKKLSPSRA